VSLLNTGSPLGEIGRVWSELEGIGIDGLELAFSHAGLLVDCDEVSAIVERLCRSGGLAVNNEGVALLLDLGVVFVQALRECVAEFISVRGCFSFRFSSCSWGWGNAPTQGGSGNWEVTLPHATSDDGTAGCLNHGDGSKESDDSSRELHVCGWRFVGLRDLEMIGVIID